MSSSDLLIPIFVEKAKKYPDSIALVNEEGSLRLTYAQLDRYSDSLSNIILDFINLVPQDEEVDTPLVSLMVDRNFSMIISILASWKAGAGYVPVDPSFPADRQAYIFSHSKCSLLIADESSYAEATMIGVELPSNVVVVSGLTGELQKKIVTTRKKSGTVLPNIVLSNKTFQSRNSSGLDLAYVLYTSGSTGKPKGVMVPQQGVVNYIDWLTTEMGAGPSSVVLALATYCFDISVLEFLLPLLNGGTLVIASVATQKDPYRIIDVLEEMKVNVFQATPTTYEMMVATGWKGDERIDFITGGEAFRPSLVTIIDHCRSFRNVYGPTETTIYSSCHNFNGIHPQTNANGTLVVSVGGPINQTQFYLVDPEGSLPYKEVPAGAEGELWIGGIGVARGYIRAPDLTEKIYTLVSSLQYCASRTSTYTPSSVSLRTIVFLYSCLRAFGYYEYYPWIDAITKQMQRQERPHTEEDLTLYKTLYDRWRAADGGWFIVPGRRKRYLDELLQLEERLPISSIMSLRRRCNGWSFRHSHLNDENKTDKGGNKGENKGKVEEGNMIRELEYPDSAEFVEDRDMSTYLSLHKGEYDYNQAVLHELWLAPFVITNIKIEYKDCQEVSKRNESYSNNYQNNSSNNMEAGIQNTTTTNTNNTSSNNIIINNSNNISSSNNNNHTGNSLRDEKQHDEGDNSETSNKGSLRYTLLLEECVASVRLLLCSDWRGRSRGATVETREPYFNWLESELKLTDFAIFDCNIHQQQSQQQQRQEQEQLEHHHTVDFNDVDHPVSGHFHSSPGTHQQFSYVNSYSCFLETRSVRASGCLDPMTTDNNQGMTFDHYHYRLSCKIVSDGSLRVDSNAYEILFSICQYKQLLDWIYLIGRIFVYRNLQPPIIIPDDLFHTPNPLSAASSIDSKHTTNALVLEQKEPSHESLPDNIWQYLWLGGLRLEVKLAFDSIDLLFLPSVTRREISERNASLADNEEAKAGVNRGLNAHIARLHGSSILNCTRDSQYFNLNIASMTWRQAEVQSKQDWFGKRWRDAVLFPFDTDILSMTSNKDIIFIENFDFCYRTAFEDCDSDELLEVEAKDGVSKLWDENMKRLSIYIGSIVLEGVVVEVLHSPILEVELSDGSRFSAAGSLSYINQCIDFKTTSQVLISTPSNPTDDGKKELFKPTYLHLAHLFDVEEGNRLLLGTADLVNINTEATGAQTVPIIDMSGINIGEISFRVEITEPLVCIRLLQLHSLEDDDGSLDSEQRSVYITLTAPLPKTDNDAGALSQGDASQGSLGLGLGDGSKGSNSGATRDRSVHGSVALGSREWKKSTFSLIYSSLINIDEFFLLQAIPNEMISIRLQLHEEHPEDNSEDLIGSVEVQFQPDDEQRGKEKTVTIRDSDNIAVADLLFEMDWYRPQAAHEKKNEISTRDFINVSSTISPITSEISRIIPDNSPPHFNAGLPVMSLKALSHQDLSSLGKDTMTVGSGDEEETKSTTSWLVHDAMLTRESAATETQSQTISDLSDFKRDEALAAREEKGTISFDDSAKKKTIVRTIRDQIDISLGGFLSNMSRHHLESFVLIVNCMNPPIPEIQNDNKTLNDRNNELIGGAISRSSTRDNFHNDVQEDRRTTMPRGALNPTPSTPHMGRLPVRCGDFGRMGLISRILGRFRYLRDLVAQSPPTEPFDEFWLVFDPHNTALVPGYDESYRHGASTVIGISRTVKEYRKIQRKLVLLFQNYLFAVEAWGLLVVPKWFKIPRIGNIRSISKAQLTQMLCPVARGSVVYVDRKVVILSITGLISQFDFISGIKTSVMDVYTVGSRFLEFEVDKPSIVWIAWDAKCTILPKWLLKRGYRRTDSMVTTSSGSHVLYKRNFSRATKVVMGGCYTKDRHKLNNYFVLVTNLHKSSTESSTIDHRQPLDTPWNLGAGLGFVPMFEINDSEPLPTQSFKDEVGNDSDSLMKNKSFVQPSWFLMHHSLIAPAISPSIHSSHDQKPSSPLPSQNPDIFNNNSDFIDDADSLQLETTPDAVYPGNKQDEQYPPSIPNKTSTRKDWKIVRSFDVKTIVGPTKVALSGSDGVESLELLIKSTSMNLLSVKDIEERWLGRLHKLCTSISTSVQIVRQSYRHRLQETHSQIADMIIHPWTLNLMVQKSNGETAMEASTSSNEILFIDLSPACARSLMGLLSEIEAVQTYAKTISTPNFVLQSNITDTNDYSTSWPGQVRPQNRFHPEIPFKLSHETDFTLEQEVVVHNQLGEEIWLEVYGMSLKSSEKRESGSETSFNDDDDDDDSYSLPEHSISISISEADPFHRLSNNNRWAFTDVQSVYSISGVNNGVAFAIPPNKIVSFVVKYNTTDHGGSQVTASDILSHVRMNWISSSDWEEIRDIRIFPGETQLYRLSLKESNMDTRHHVYSHSKGGPDIKTVSSAESMISLENKSIKHNVSPFSLVVNTSMKDLNEIQSYGGIASKEELEMGTGTWNISSNNKLRKGVNRVADEFKSNWNRRINSISRNNVNDLKIGNQLDDGRKDIFLVALSTNITLLNESKGIISLLDRPPNSFSAGDWVENSIQLTEVTATPLPLSVLRDGSLHLHRSYSLTGCSPEFAQDPNEENEYPDYEFLTLSINSQMFDLSVSKQLRRSFDYECQSVIVEENQRSSIPILVMESNVAAHSERKNLTKNDLLSRSFSSQIWTAEGSNEVSTLWDIKFLPALICTNALPCSLLFQISQPPFPTPITSEDMKLSSIDGAQEIFFLPEAFYSYSESTLSGGVGTGSGLSMQAVSIQEQNDWTPFGASVDTDGHLHRNSNTIYTATSDGWTVSQLIHSGDDLILPFIKTDRTVYLRITLPGTNLWSIPIAIPIHLLQHRIPFHKHKPEVIHWDFSPNAEYHRCRPPSLFISRSWDILQNRKLEIFSEFWVVNKSGLDLKYATDTTSNNISLSRDNFSAAFNSNYDHTSVQPLFLYNPTKLRKLISNQSSPILPVEYDDIDHSTFLNSNEVPVLLDSVQKELKIMICSTSNLTKPEDLRFTRSIFYEYNIETSLLPSEYVISRGLQEEIIYFPVTLSTSHYGQDPRASASVAKVIPKWPSMFSSIPDPQNAIMFVQLAEKNDKFDRISDSSQDYFSFQISEDAFVYVCIDSRCVYLPHWMLVLGFRFTGESFDLYNSDGFTVSCSFHVYRRFYQKSSHIRLNLAKGRGPYDSADPVEPLEMYFVVIVKQAVPVLEPTIEIGVGNGKSQLKYNVVSSFMSGDKMFIDSDARITELPSILRKIPLVGIITLNKEKHIRGEDLLSISLRQPSRVFLCIDSKINQRTLPRWILDVGFERTPYIIRGNGEPFSFQVYSSTFPSGTISLGGLGGCRSRCNYLVVVAHGQCFLPIQTESKSSETLQTDISNYEHVVIGLSETSVGTMSNRDATCQQRSLERSAKSFLRSCWDEDHMKPLIYQHPPLNELQRIWSSPFHIFPGTRGNLTVSQSTIAVSVQPLPGIFHRTSVITFLPKYLILNRTNNPLLIWPHIGHQQNLIDYLHRNHNQSSSHHSSDWDSSHRLQPEPIQLLPSETCAVYNFWDAQTGAPDIKRYISLEGVNLHRNASSSHFFSVDSQGSTGHLLSREICVEEFSEKFLWLVHSSQGVLSRDRPRLNRYILQVTVAREGISTIVTIKDSSTAPPYRLENRSIAVTLRFRQAGLVPSNSALLGPDAEESGWTDLPPHSWRSFIWPDYDFQPRLLEVAVLGEEENSVKYSLDEVAQTRAESIPWGFKGIPRADILENLKLDLPWEWNLNLRGDIDGKDDVSKSSKSSGMSQMLQSTAEDVVITDECGFLGACVYLDGNAKVLAFFDENMDIGRRPVRGDRVGNILNQFNYSTRKSHYGPTSYDTDVKSRYSKRSDSILMHQMKPFHGSKSQPVLQTGDGFHMTKPEGTNYIQDILKIFKTLKVAVTFSGFCVTLIDDVIACSKLNPNTNETRKIEKATGGWDEVLTVSLEGLVISLDGSTGAFTLSLFHFQVDDMNVTAKFPVVLIGTDSGLNSHLRQINEQTRDSVDALPTDKTNHDEEVKLHPLLRIYFEAPKLNSNVIHINTLQVILSEISVKLDMDLVMRLVGFLGKMIPATESGAGHRKMMKSTAVNQARSLLILELSKSVERASNRFIFDIPIYIESLFLGSVSIQTEVLASPQFVQLDPSSLEEPVAVGFAILGSPVLSFVSWIVGSIAHISPTFTFNEFLVSNYFGSHHTLLNVIVKTYLRQGITQVYKVFGSMEILGDPLALVSDLGTGVLGFLRTTHAEMVGQTDTRGHGVRILANAVVGSTFGSASKMTNTLAQLVKSAAGIDSSPTYLQSHSLSPAREPDSSYIDPHHGDAKHQRLKSDKSSFLSGSADGVSQGLRQGGEVFVQSVVAGISGLVEEPAKGMNEGFAGAVKGTCKGVIGFVAAPVAGALGAVAVLAESVEMSAKFWRGRPVGRRRPNRGSRNVVSFKDVKDGGGLVKSSEIPNDEYSSTEPSEMQHVSSSEGHDVKTHMTMQSNSTAVKARKYQPKSKSELVSPLFPTYPKII